MLFTLNRVTLIRIRKCTLSALTVCKRFNMTSESYTYEETIAALNSLQSNAAYVQKARLERHCNPGLNLCRTVKYLSSLGIKVEDLNVLNIIHVSGTKGKGSTCALTESILRHHGAKTGFYSSPHLVLVTERIRINGKPISKPLFISYFWHVYNTLKRNLEDNENMPMYFMFLTIMTFYVFLKEKVDVAIIEVGIGGLYDCTNVIEKPVAVGIATLGFDHIQLLGNTIEQIAHQKAGIFKPFVPAFTVSQPESALAVLWDQAQLVGCPLHVVPPFEVYDQEVQDSQLENLGMIQNLNASLAIQLSNAWLNRDSEKAFPSQSSLLYRCDKSKRIPLAPLFPLSPMFVIGIVSCTWPGRFHTVKKDNFTFYLDGAHTQQSIKHCVRWFQEVSEKEKSQINGTVCQVLLFNCTGERTAETMLDVLSSIPFDVALFSPNRLMTENKISSDQNNLTVDMSTETNRCQSNRDIWCHIMSGYHEEAVTNVSQPSSIKAHSDPDGAKVFPCLSKALEWIMEKRDTKSNYDCLQKVLHYGDHYQILVTGSLHLVGGVLSIVEADAL